jgi:uncharacterized short protein YbdD (DUF466 family)
MPNILSRFTARLRRCTRLFGRSIREWSGDAAYSHYLRAASKSAAQQPLLTQEQFYLDQLNRRYSRPNRCC